MFSPFINKLDFLLKQSNGRIYLLVYYSEFPLGNLVALTWLPTGRYSTYLSLAGLHTKDASLVCLSVVRAKLLSHSACLVKVAVDFKPDDTHFPTAKTSKYSEDLSLPLTRVILTCKLLEPRPVLSCFRRIS